MEKFYNLRARSYSLVFRNVLNGKLLRTRNTYMWAAKTQIILVDVEADMNNHWVPTQPRRLVWPDLCPNRLQKLSANDTGRQCVFRRDR